MPPLYGSMEGIDSLADKVGVLGCQFSGIKACNDADESRVSFDVVAPMILTGTYPVTHLPSYDRKGF